VLPYIASIHHEGWQTIPGRVRLPAEEVELYFRLSIALLLYANRRLRLLPGVESRAAFLNSSLEAKAELRDAVYDQPELIDAFVADNPAGFSAEELAVVGGWKRCVRGSFYLVRFLKRYAVFLDTGPPPRAYGVLGLHDELDELFPDLRPPIYLRAALLPFKGRIIHDGFVQAMAIYFGPGIRASLDEAYRVAKETRGVIQTLDAEPVSVSGPRPARRRPTPELGPRLERLAQELSDVHGSTIAEQKVLALLRAAARLGRVVTDDDNDDPVVLERALRRTRTALTQLEATIHRSALWGEPE
jgi:hypothetical protein